MKTYNTQAEIDADIKDGVLVVNDSVEFKCSFSVEASLKIDGDINAGDINAWDINARNINAGDITAGDINAGDINAWDINAWDINAGNITVRDINAWDINAWDIDFWAVCIAYVSMKIKSAVARRSNSILKCLDQEIEYKK